MVNYETWPHRAGALSGMEWTQAVPFVRLAAPGALTHRAPLLFAPSLCRSAEIVVGAIVTR